MTQEDLLLEARPSNWNFFFHWLFFFLVIPPIIALWKKAALVVQVFSDRIVVKRGVLSKDVKVLFLSDVRTVDLKQSLFQRIFNVGAIMIATAGDEYEIVARGLPNPTGIKDLLIQQRRASAKTAD